MAESLYELLQPHLASSRARDDPAPLAFAGSSTISRYLSRLTTLPLGALSTTEPQAISQAAHSNDLSLQALASRSHKTVINSSDSLSTLNTSIPDLSISARALHDAIPALDQEAIFFSTKYSKTNSENAVLDRRKEAMLLSRNVDRVSDILELPTLLSSTITSASANTSGAGTNYSQALDLFAHIKRLSLLHPDSAIIKSVLAEAEEAMKDMTSNLITSLRGPNIRLAAAIRTIGWLRRVVPDLTYPAPSPPSISKSTTLTNPITPAEGLFGSLFLTARLAHLLHLLSALTPLADLADQETARRLSSPPTQASSTRKPSYSTVSGTHTERYLKRYIEIFREQSFATVSMYRNIFPPPPPTPQTQQDDNDKSLLLPLPPALATFPMHLVDLLMDTLRKYLPNITDPSVRESLLTQVLYAAGSLGRLGADFGMMIALLEDEDEADKAGFTDEPVQVNGDGANGDTKDERLQTPESEHTEIPEWVRVMKKHRIQAGRLEALAASHET